MKFMESNCLHCNTALYGFNSTGRAPYACTVCGGIILLPFHQSCFNENNYTKIKSFCILHKDRVFLYPDGLSNNIHHYDGERSIEAILVIIEK